MPRMANLRTRFELLGRRCNSHGYRGRTLSRQISINRSGCINSECRTGKQRNNVETPVKRYFCLTTDDLLSNNLRQLTRWRYNSSRKILKRYVLSTTPCNASVPGPLPSATTSSTVTSADFV